MIPYYLAIYAIGTAIILYFARETKSFLASHASIDHPDGLEAFKRLARRNMTMALPYGLFMIIGVALGLHIVQQDNLAGFSLFAAANIPFMTAALALRRLEIQARELPCTDPVFIVEYNRVSRSWLQDLWPKF
ncbi:hypothetical protein SAMN02949497_3308 [Methylomagnum ishizawai]|uniref:Uncharacterized protein n=1 Tax=Methylomagnum ishizawai TaxID=1760988 RepID=A0A1Y6D0F6_9GAMM|nr:hypothetical protein [Methylomagnum ishizawai]SMF95930.1 hypothetical protein SAMN02949497_3308 [Methylomagnum ishizawai]